MNYTWKIETVDATTNSMVVAYELSGVTTRLNLPIPTADEDIGAWVHKFAPHAEWKKATNAVQTASVQEGQEGTGVFDPAEAEPATVQSEPPSVFGNLNEEYIRALIYQVLEEIRESQV